MVYMALDIYPIPGTHAETIRNHIAANPGSSVNGIITALKLNPSPARKVIAQLLEKGLIEDRTPKGPNHTYHAKTPAM